MIRSMTGFGQGEAGRDGFQVNIEVRSVNHRYRDLKIRMPADLSPLENEIRKKIHSRVRRGRLEISISIERKKSPSYRVEVDRGLITRYLRAARLLKKEFRLEGEVSLQSVMQLSGAVKVEADRRSLDGRETGVLYRALDRALDSLDRVRQSEGDHLCKDLKKRLARIGRYKEQFRKSVTEAPRQLSRRLQRRLEELLPGGRVPRERIAQEAALLAEKSDITEEIVRLDSHLQQAGKLLEGSNPAPGKRLDFLMQEMNREANTIAAKTTHLKISRGAIEIKAEVEKIREQVQNLE